MMDCFMTSSRWCGVEVWRSRSFQFQQHCGVVIFLYFILWVYILSSKMGVQFLVLVACCYCGSLWALWAVRGSFSAACCCHSICYLLLLCCRARVPLDFKNLLRQGTCKISNISTSAYNFPWHPPFFGHLSSWGTFPVELHRGCLGSLRTYSLLGFAISTAQAHLRRMLRSSRTSRAAYSICSRTLACLLFGATRLQSSLPLTSMACSPPLFLL